jgi:hypothetical protein
MCKSLSGFLALCLTWSADMSSANDIPDSRLKRVVENVIQADGGRAAIAYHEFVARHAPGTIKLIVGVVFLPLLTPHCHNRATGVPLTFSVTGCEFRPIESSMH